MDRSGNIAAFLNESGWLPGVAGEEVCFLAAGEYNENHLVRSSEGAYVLRINHGSQLGQTRQIEYEFNVLQVLQESGVTPRVFRVEASPPEKFGFGKGVLLMEYLEGRPLDYATDSDTAAAIFARVHRMPLPASGKEEGGLPSLVVQARPVRDIADESLGLLRRHPEHPLRTERRRLLEYHAEIEKLAEETMPLFESEPLVVVNTEVNSHNFIIGESQSSQGWLVDWEKAVISQRWQDLGHFLVPTTTQWKRDFVYTREQKRAFLANYLRHAGLDLDLDAALLRTEVLERTILLRALSWCFMAWFEYTRQERALKNQDTFAKIEQYLGQMEELLG